MPKLIDYPRTNYEGAWELCEVVDDTGGKCAVETAARKLDRKVSGSFKAIIGSAVKFGLLTSKRELLSTTTLFKRIKHAYDKEEEILFHREAFLTPPLFTQLCRKFRSKELPVQMLDVMLIREFGVEEINAQGVAKAFVEGCRMVGLLDEHNIIVDIDALPSKQLTRRQLNGPQPMLNGLSQAEFQPEQTDKIQGDPADGPTVNRQYVPAPGSTSPEEPRTSTVFVPQQPTPEDFRPAASFASRTEKPDVIASLFGLTNPTSEITTKEETTNTINTNQDANPQPKGSNESSSPQSMGPRKTLDFHSSTTLSNPIGVFQIQISGPGISTTLSIIEEDDISLAIALLEKIRRQLKA